jgi:hypothetical protein
MKTIHYKSQINAENALKFYMAQHEFRKLGHIIKLLFSGLGSGSARIV